MYPSRERPELGVFVRDQLDALCRIEPPVEAELFAFAPGGALTESLVRADGTQRGTYPDGTIVEQTAELS